MKHLNESEVASEKHDAWFVYMYSRMTIKERRASSDAANRKGDDGVVFSSWRLVQGVSSGCYSALCLNSIRGLMFRGNVLVE